MTLRAALSSRDGSVRREYAADGDALGDPSRGLLRSEAVVDVALVPRPRSLDVRSGTVTLHSPLRVAVPSEWHDIVATFASDLAASVGWDVELVDAATPSDVIIRRVSDCAEEEYRLSIDDGVTIDACAGS